MFHNFFSVSSVPLWFNLISAEVNMTDKAITAESVETLLGEIAGEFFERAARGERPRIEEYVERYPELADQIRRVIPALELIGASVSSASGAEGLLHLAPSVDRQITGWPCP